MKKKRYGYSITKENRLTPKDIGKSYDFWKQEYDYFDGVVENGDDKFLMTALLVEFKDNAAYFILPIHNIKMLGPTKRYECDYYKLFFYETALKQKSEKYIQALLKKSHTPDEVMFHYSSPYDTNSKPQWYKGSLDETSHGSTDDLWLSYHQYNYQACNLKNEDWYKSYFLTDPDVKSSIKLLTLVHKNGELPDDLLINFDYPVHRFEIKKQEVVGYYITHKDAERYIPKECTKENNNKVSNKIDKVTSDFASKLDKSIPSELKFLITENFRNNLEIEKLKVNNEIAKIKNYLYEDNFKLMGEALVGVNSKIDALNYKIDKNLSDVLKKINSLENNFNNKINKINERLSKYEIIAEYVDRELIEPKRGKPRTEPLEHEYDADDAAIDRFLAGRCCSSSHPNVTSAGIPSSHVFYKHGQP